DMGVSCSSNSRRSALTMISSNCWAQAGIWVMKDALATAATRILRGKRARRRVFFNIQNPLVFQSRPVFLARALDWQLLRVGNFMDLQLYGSESPVPADLLD